ncbi:helix-turn-helix domain-containing protein [Aeromonas rivipollensis]|uniref:helix-turn-helix domain-containing protein n=1 Tax=Aeromonas rivipollensis TaxID=948519 RepID=UPI00259EFFA7|nr:helix-turn-helix domain-containing protein [Aeromonas rivipollensis]MDM5083701.1 helix-turn-helix domain-containing protein [Aeromonas rivipollensis]MDM5096079.1 helix-turn-helix domain-containing protein [Aeromonas rivipollensis]MDM5104368.1 helix-turn-helix domain-containing protein [Aeromonas rivipollensis]
MKKRTDQSNLTIPPLNDACRKRLRLLRERLGLSRPKFADMLGIPPTTLKNYELNYREISGGTLLLIAQHPELSAHFAWLMTGQESEPAAAA